MAVGQSFHAYPSRRISYPSGVVAAFQADVKSDTLAEAWDDTGWYDSAKFALVVPTGVSRVVLQLTANVCWADLPVGAHMGIFFTKNSLEYRGLNAEVFQLNLSLVALSQQITGLAVGKAGDSFGVSLYQNCPKPRLLAGTVNKHGFNVMNYFEGVILAQS